MKDRQKVIDLAARQASEAVKRVADEYNALRKVEDPTRYYIEPQHFTSLFYTLLTDELEKEEKKTVKSRMTDALLLFMPAVTLGLVLYIALMK